MCCCQMKCFVFLDILEYSQVFSERDTTFCSLTYSVSTLQGSDHLYVLLSVCLSISIHPFIHLSVYLYLSIHPSIHPSIYLNLSISAYLSTHLSIRPSILHSFIQSFIHSSTIYLPSAQEVTVCLYPDRNDSAQHSRMIMFLNCMSV